MKNLDWSKILGKAGRAGRNAILRNYTAVNRHKIIKRGVGGDMTLRIDEVSEKAIYNSLKADLGKSFVFLSEELGEKPGLQNSEGLPVVVCDPLDGSHNAEVGIPFFSLALSVIDPGKNVEGRGFGNIVGALILSIKTDDEYTAIKGKGSFHNGTRLKTSYSSDKVQTLLVETGDVDYLREKILSKLSKKEIYKTRLLGSAALSYCMLAERSAEALVFAQPGGARTIDSPAGYLIAREAGCVFSNLTEDHGKLVEDVEVGFSSRMNVLGAANETILSMLEKKLVSLP
jgi:fructose-1,6-bisphosphatase/inositol monophosphatase family enzyme